MRIARNLNEMIKITSNEKYDFYIKKVNREWFTYTMEKDTNINVTMAGFSTKKVATNAAHSWATWQK